jgi:hypothetical protein
MYDIYLPARLKARAPNQPNHPATGIPETEVAKDAPEAVAQLPHISNLQQRKPWQLDLGNNKN